MSRTNFSFGRLAEDFFFFDSLPLLRRELPPVPQAPQLLCLRAARGRCGFLEESGYFSFRFLPLVVLPETLSRLRVRLASRRGGCQFANQGSIGGSKPTAISGHARGPIVRQGPWGFKGNPEHHRV